MQFGIGLLGKHCSFMVKVLSFKLRSSCTNMSCPLSEGGMRAILYACILYVDEHARQAGCIWDFVRGERLD